MIPVPATFHDGSVARGQAVQVTVDGPVLSIRDGDAGEIKQWPCGDVRYVDAADVRDADRGGRVRLRRVGGEAERLILANGASAILSQCPNLSGPPLVPRLRWVAAILVIVISTGGAGWYGITEGIPRSADYLAAKLPPTFEARLGESQRDRLVHDLTEDARKKGRSAVCSSVLGDAAMRSLVTRLSDTAAESMRVTVTVADSFVINAFALPGGQIVVTRGLLEFMHQPDEVAGVLAHEMGHVAHRHPTAIAIRQMGGSLLVSLLFGGLVFEDAAEAASSMIALGYSREAERQADSFASDVISRAGYDPNHLGVFFTRLAAAEGDTPGIAQFFVSHPPFAQRISAVSSHHAVAGSTVVMSPEEWQRLRAICK